MKKVPSFRGFTLIELLVVVGVIGILIGLLLPYLSEARRQSKTIQCVSNYRSIGQTLRNYATDWDENLPKTNPGGYVWSHVWFNGNPWKGDSNATVANWSGAGSPDIRGVLQGYVPNKFSFKSWQCPFIDGPPMGDLDASGNYRLVLSTDNSSWHVYGNFSMPFTCYFGASNQSGMFASFISRGYADAVNGFPSKLAKANSGLMLAQDAFWDYPHDGTGLMSISHLRGGVVMSYPSSATPGTCNNVVSNKSLGLGASMVFYDGSARFVPANELVRSDSWPANSRGFQFWTVLP